MASETYSHGHHRSVVDVHALRTARDCAAYLLPELQPGVSILDVGCGPGSITADFAALAAPGPVVGLDSSEDVLVSARARAAGRGLANASFVAGNVYDLDFPDETFDVVHAHQVLQHLMDPVAALREMRRVAKPGGLVAVRDADFAGMIWHPPTPELAQWMRIYREIARGNSAEPDAGRHLLAWALEAGFTEITPSSSNWLYATPEERRRHAESWSERVLHSAFAEQARERGLADRHQLEQVAAGWREWADAPDGWFLIPCGELLLRA
ncbi:methyltransferase domain-containing protein [Arthrobacter sp. zg-Y859]|uniref:Methyltransferase domain-containing protein n=1 Tax=Arthrobacter jinronghuae TaxID=2964609 RepID=A0ABT1NMR7_9MICC|nr:methyltransferase domain-containing protein [Arthrobacter jinronghuae]MCQ1949015.1 methyltransferase domain-containing protein [Arthrobacter jinronghuae]UWX78187.1 methyltransferase domain-containing protein [Arthrobacter jinronghuae]